MLPEWHPEANFSGRGITKVARIPEKHSMTKCYGTPFRYVVGVINRDRVNAFERVLWRACHHTAYVRSSEIEELFEDPDTVRTLLYTDHTLLYFQGEKMHKSVFIVFYKGDRLKTIVDKVGRVWWITV